MLIGEYQLNLSDQSRQELVYLNSTPIATVTPTGTYRVYADHLDTSRRVAINNQESEVLWEWESKPFGESLANEDADGDGKIFRLNLRFPGQYFDAETQTHYNINRDYNPVTGRYIQSDPIGFGYVGGRPIMLIDENGLYVLSKLTFKKARYHYMHGDGSPIYVKASSVNLSKVKKRDFKYIGHKRGVQLFYHGHEYTNDNDALVYGGITLIYAGNSRVAILPDYYNFEMHKWRWNSGLLIRNVSTAMARLVHHDFQSSFPSTHPFDIYFVGTVKIK